MDAHDIIKSGAEQSGMVFAQAFTTADKSRQDLRRQVDGQKKEIENLTKSLAAEVVESRRLRNIIEGLPTKSDKRMMNLLSAAWFSCGLLVAVFVLV